MIISLLDLGVEVLEMYCHGIFNKKFVNLELFIKNLESQFLAQYHSLFIGTLKGLAGSCASELYELGNETQGNDESPSSDGNSESGSDNWT